LVASYEGDQHREDAGWQVVSHVVDHGGGGAESAIASAAVAHHGVHGVDGSVSARARRPEQDAPEHGRDDGVDGVLGDRLDDCGADSAGV